MVQDFLPFILALLLIGVLLRLQTKRREAMRASREASARRDAAAAAATPADWAPPRYAAARDAKAGPSLRIAIEAARLGDAGLLVSWSATNNGSLPLAVQWGAPRAVVEADWLQLRYLLEAQSEPAAPDAAATSFAAPEMRTCQPGEILSRSITVARETLDPAWDGKRVTVAVGYGNANEYDAACADQGTYLDWQRVTVSPFRNVSQR